MKKIKLLTCGVLALSLAFITACSSSKVEKPSNPIDFVDMEVSTYLRTWPLGSTPEQMKEGVHWTAEDVKGEYLSELIVAFAHVDQETWGLKFPDVNPDAPAEGEEAKIPFPNLWDEVAAIQKKYPHMDMNVSVGGWGAKGFSEMSADPEKRGKFVTAVSDLVKEKNLNGIDIDWEYPIGPDWDNPNPADGPNFVALLQDLRASFDAIEAETGRHISLSIAVPAGPWYVQKHDVKNISSIVDTMKVMSYDFYGDWSATTGHTASLYTRPDDPGDKLSIDAVVQNYINAGVPAEKLIVGIAFFGRGWKGVEAGENGDGLYQPYAEGAYSDGLSWADTAPFLAEDSGYTRYWDDVAKAPYLYNGDEFISYVDAEAVKCIGEYVRENKLGGAMVWEYGHDVNCELFPVLVNSLTDPELFKK